MAPDSFVFRGGKVSFKAEGEGPNLLLIPGLSGRLAFWDRAWPFLASRFRVISFDHPGCGGSQPPGDKPTVEGHADLAVALLDHLSVEKSHVVGHSMGGAIAQVMAIEQSDRVASLVLSSTWAEPDAYFCRAFAQRSEILETLGMDAYIRAQTLMVFPPDTIAKAEDEIEAFEAAAAKTMAEAPLMLARIQALLAFDRSSDLARILHPTLVTIYQDDLVIPPHMSRALYGKLAEAQFHAFAEGGHFGPAIEAETFCDTLAGFLDEGR